MNMKSTLISSLRRAFLVAVLAFGVAAGSAIGSTAAVPVISILTMDAMTAGYIGAQVFTWRTDGRALQFEAAASGFHNSPVDVYFGVVAPGERVFTWSPAAGAPNLREGLFPAGQGITASEIYSVALLGSSPQYTFPAGSPLGIYSVFFILVYAGNDPRDARQWLAANMSPLVITN